MLSLVPDVVPLFVVVPVSLFVVSVLFVKFTVFVKSCVVAFVKSCVARFVVLSVLVSVLLNVLSVSKEFVPVLSVVPSRILLTISLAVCAFTVLIVFSIFSN